MAKEKRETSKSAVLGGFLNWFNKQVVNNGFKKEEIEELINSFVAKISPVIKDSGKEVTDVISDLVGNAFVCAVLDIKETQRLSELSIQNAVRENFDRLQKNQDEFINSVLSHIDKKHKDIFDAINSLNEEYAKKAQKQSDLIFNQLETLTTTVFDMKNTVEGTNIEVAEIRESLKNFYRIKDIAYTAYLKAGWDYLCLGEFDRAEEEFYNAINKNEESHEAHFGLALASHKIQLLDISGKNDNQDGEISFNKIPIYSDIPNFRYNREGITPENTPHYMYALKYSAGLPTVQKRYESCVKEINETIRYFKKFKENGDKYSCFICAKVSQLDNNNDAVYGTETEDCLWARKLYSELTRKNLDPFFSEIDIKEKGTAYATKYEARILYALIHSKCMIVVCSEQKYFDNSKYMQSEFNRFKSFLRGRGITDYSNIVVVSKTKDIDLFDYSSNLQNIKRPELPVESEKGSNAEIYEEKLNLYEKRENETIRRVIDYVNLKVNGAGIDLRIKKYCPECGKLYTGEKDKVCTQCACKLLTYDEYESMRLSKLNKDIEEQETALQRIKAEAELSANKIIQSANEQAQKKIKEVEELRRIAEADAEKNKSIIEKEREDYKKREEIISRQLSTVKQDKDKTEKKLEEIQRLLEEERKAYSALKQEFEQKAVQPVFYPTLDTYDKSEFKIEGTILKKYLGKNPVVYIPQGVTAIGEKAFIRCDKIKSVTIPNGVLKIDDMAFDVCRSLTDIKLPNTLVSIGYCAFANCKSLTNIIIPYSVTYIAKWAFEHCDSLIRVTIPGRVSNLDERAFEGCASLKCIAVSEDNKNYCDVDGVLFNKEKTQLLCYPAGKELQKYAIPESVTVIKDDAFAWSKLLQEVIISASVVSLSSEVFTCSKSLKNITVSRDNKNYSDIDGVLFNKEKTTLICYPAGKATHLYNSYTIPSGVKEIGENAFYFCEKLINVTIPQEVNCIRYGAFYSCDSLKKIEIPANVKTIEDNVFYFCYSLNRVTIPLKFKNDLDRIFSSEKNHIQFEFYDDES